MDQIEQDKFQNLIKKNKRKDLFFGNINFINLLYQNKILARDHLIQFINFGLSFYINNYYNPQVSKEIKDTILEGIIKLIEYAGKALKKLKKKKRKKKI